MKKIITITGESGTGKTSLVEFVKDNFDISMIESYTDREMRVPNEVGHVFLSTEEYNEIQLEDMIAFTKFGNARYCCIKDDVKDINTYVIEESGIEYLATNFKDEFEVITIRLQRPKVDRLDCVGFDRVQRDEGRFNRPIENFDYIIHNNGTMNTFYTNIKKVFQNILED